MRIPIVDENDEIIKYIERKDRTATDTCRITCVLVFNSKGEFLIAQRQFTKPLDPGKWGPSVAGTVEEGETYDTNAIKELEEEIGVKDTQITFFNKHYYKTYNAQRFTSVYIAHVDKRAEDFVIQQDEVAEVRWISIDDLSSWYTKSPEDFIPSFSNTLERVKEYANQN